MAVDAGEVDDVESHRKFVVAKAETSRQLSEAGHGAWFGAFLDGELRSTMGLVRADTGLARFQNVETHPDARGRGLAGTLVHHVSEYGFARAGRFDPGDGRRPGLPRDPGLPLGRLRDDRGAAAGPAQLTGRGQPSSVEPRR